MGKGFAPRVRASQTLLTISQFCEPLAVWAFQPAFLTKSTITNPRSLTKSGF